MGRRIPVTISEKELLELLKNVKSKKRKLAFMLGFYEGMRVSEVVKLKKENIDIGRKLVMIKQGKGKKDRHIPIAPEVMHWLRYLPVGVGARALQISVRKLVKKVLEKDFHFHDLRHSGASHYHNEKRWSTRDVQVFLGHSRIQTTEIYTHVNPLDLVNRMWKDPPTA